MIAEFNDHRDTVAKLVKTKSFQLIAWKLNPTLVVITKTIATPNNPRRHVLRVEDHSENRNP